ncbi:MAG TPA: phenylacetic acid degradation operon negative regulatory protein PaaX [Steroidobacteraceae bacterium]|nr:phenylacetic acid degradation operon negative regulatory protein PaaX [Steroidobacteraceae bacterium]
MASPANTGLAAPLEAAVAALVRHFRRQRPVRGGSLIITIFGDSIAPRGGSISLASLIALARPFGLTERLVRTSVARLAKDGWLEAERRGRLSFYRLAKPGRARFEEATRRIYSENPRDWRGRWTLVVLPKGSRTRRERLREEMLWLGFGQLTPGVLVHPEHELEAARRQLRELKIPGHVTVLQAVTGDESEDRRIAAASWDLSELSRGYRRFVDLFGPVQDALAERPSPLPAFIVRTLLIHEYRKVHLRDPLLPASLLPADWVGAEAYELCRALYARVFAAADAHLSQSATTVTGRLAAPSETAFRRFGGLEKSGSDLFSGAGK